MLCGQARNEDLPWRNAGGVHSSKRMLPCSHQWGRFEGQYCPRCSSAAHPAWEVAYIFPNLHFIWIYNQWGLRKNIWRVQWRFRLASTWYQNVAGDGLGSWGEIFLSSAVQSYLEMQGLKMKIFPLCPHGCWDLLANVVNICSNPAFAIMLRPLILSLSSYDLLFLIPWETGLNSEH